MNRTEKIKNRVDFKMLTQTLAIQTRFNDDEAMLTFIRSRLRDINVTVQEDGYGNIYVTKGKAKSYPCVVAHTDTVHEVLKDVNIFRSGDTLFAFDPIKRAQCGIGGDDKVGVYITLQLLSDLPIMKAVFFRDEEIGCKGSNYSITNHKDWYKDCGFVLMADRRGNKDIVTVSGGVVCTSLDFLETCDPLFKKYGYKDTVGIFTDIDMLTVGGIGISTVNFSSGYHEPHSNREIVSINDINVCYNLMYDIIIEHGEKEFLYKASIPDYKFETFRYKSTKTENNSYVHNVNVEGASMKIKERQLKLYAPLWLGSKSRKYENFKESDVVKSNRKVYDFCGVKALSLTSDIDCSKCKTSVLENVFFLPYEGRMYCTKCNDYISDSKVPKLLEHLEVEDNDDTFVYSLYSNGWILKNQAVWNENISSWVDDELPF